MIKLLNDPVCVKLDALFPLCCHDNASQYQKGMFCMYLKLFTKGITAKFWISNI